MFSFLFPPRVVRVSVTVSFQLSSRLKEKLRPVKDWDQLNFTVFTITCMHVYIKRTGDEVLKPLSQVLHT